MSDEPLIRRLLEDALQTGRAADELCDGAGRPDLARELRTRLAQLNRVRDEVDSLFPDAPPPESGPGGWPAVPGHDVDALLVRGGVGVVYRATHRRLGRPVAVKMLLAGAYAGPRDLLRFRREASVLAGLEHPNLVRVHEAGDVGGLPYFTMELVGGGTFAARLAGVPQPAGSAAELVRTLAGAVQAAHDRGVVHRDLKPANVLLAADGTPKVSDFGLARPTDPDAAVTRTGARVGTPSYMAPEQAAGGPDSARPAVDIYALGAVLYECLTGRPPFRADTPSETERQVLSDDPVPPRRLNPAVPRDLETVRLACLYKDPRGRYPSAAALADDLGRFARG